MNFANIFKSAGDGQPEIARTSLVVGIIATVVTPIVFESLDMAHNGWHFDPAVWCVVYPAGIVALIAGGAFSVGKKEKDLAVARQTQATTDATVAATAATEQGS